MSLPASELRPSGTRTTGGHHVARNEPFKPICVPEPATAVMAAVVVMVTMTSPDAAQLKSAPPRHVTHVS